MSNTVQQNYLRSQLFEKAGKIPVNTFDSARDKKIRVIPDWSERKKMFHEVKGRTKDGKKILGDIRWDSEAPVKNFKLATEPNLRAYKDAGKPFSEYQKDLKEWGKRWRGINKAAKETRDSTKEGYKTSSVPQRSR